MKETQLRRSSLDARLALEDAGISILESDTIRLTEGEGSLWIAGLGEQLAARRKSATEAQPALG